jgi:hypothetical protein
MFELNFKHYFNKIYALILKGLFSNYASKPFGSFMKFYLEISFIYENMFVTALNY